MRGAGWLFSLLIAAVGVSCARPLGSIYGSGTASADVLWAVPYRVVYDMNALFLRRSSKSDVVVFTTDTEGAVRSIPIKDVTINIITNPNQPNELVLIPPDEDYQLQSPGRKIIVISYDDLSVEYSIEVKDPLGVGEETDGGSGLIIIWKRP